MLGWRVNGQSMESLSGAPLERLIETEAFGVDLALRVEIGELWEGLLAKEGSGRTARVVGITNASHPTVTEGRRQ